MAITCPHCGMEYLPEEIFYRQDMYGNLSHIAKDVDGKILRYDGVSAPMLETYTCDKCNTKFSVQGFLRCKVTPINTTFLEETIIRRSKNG